MRSWRRFLLGMLVGIIFSISFAELIHQTVDVETLEISAGGVCSIIYDRLARRWNPDFAYQVKLVYKIFAWPVKTLYIAISEHQTAVKDGRRDWVFSPTR